MSVGKGGRPAKEYKIARNRNSFKCFKGNEYVGSISVKELCLYIAKINGVLLEIPTKKPQQRLDIMKISKEPPLGNIEFKDFYFTHAPKRGENPDEKWVAKVIDVIETEIKPDNLWRELGYKLNDTNLYADVVFKKEGKYILVEVQAENLKRKMELFVGKDFEELFDELWLIVNPKEVNFAKEITSHFKIPVKFMNGVHITKKAIGFLDLAEPQKKSNGVKNQPISNMKDGTEVQKGVEAQS